MKTIRLLSSLLLASLLFTTVACGGPLVDKDGVVPTAGRYSSETEHRLLDFLNDQTETTLRRLDVDCELRADVAGNLIVHRDGLDGLAGTPDDDLFDTVDEVDDVGGVGPTSMERLLTCSSWFAPTEEPAVDRVEVVTELERLQPELAALITGELELEAERRADPTLEAPVVFEAVTIYSAEGKPVRYEVDYLQGSDHRIRLTLDASLALIPEGELG